MAIFTSQKGEERNFLRVFENRFQQSETEDIVGSFEKYRTLRLRLFNDDDRSTRSLYSPTKHFWHRCKSDSCLNLTATKSQVAGRGKTFLKCAEQN